MKEVDISIVLLNLGIESLSPRLSVLQEQPNSYNETSQFLCSLRNCHEIVLNSEDYQQSVKSFHMPEEIDLKIELEHKILGSTEVALLARGVLRTDEQTQTERKQWKIYPSIVLKYDVISVTFVSHLHTM